MTKTSKPSLVQRALEVGDVGFPDVSPHWSIEQDQVATELLKGGLSQIAGALANALLRLAYLDEQAARPQAGCSECGESAGCAENCPTRADEGMPTVGPCPFAAGQVVVVCDLGPRNSEPGKVVTGQGDGGKTLVWFRDGYEACFGHSELSTVTPPTALSELRAVPGATTGNGSALANQFEGIDSRNPCCWACTPDFRRMLLCRLCGNKRCPHASNHQLECTGSNEAGQPGSIYQEAIAYSLALADPPPEPVAETTPNNEQLPYYCTGCKAYLSRRDARTHGCDEEIIDAPGKGDR